jgi:hypothetical protein
MVQFLFQENKANRKNPDAVNIFEEFIGRRLDDVQTLGKELFMYFGDKCFRYLDRMFILLTKIHLLHYKYIGYLQIVAQLEKL